ncbi:unnamed protein product [Callosobruchus maculatus]|uniref:Uncharacterized protein n=1 Tax=Callosobruchus maculatus TaxID=64391 RepID=A0A653CX59_CALMS|nr:unnamed protein product [Callosobruchus maculatus]
MAGATTFCTITTIRLWGTSTREDSNTITSQARRRKDNLSIQRFLLTQTESPSNFRRTWRVCPERITSPRKGIAGIPTR